MERRYETIDNNTLASLRRGHNGAFILLIIGIAGLAFSLVTIFLIFPILLIMPFIIVITIGTYLTAVQEMRREKPGLGIGLVLGGIATFGIWPLVHAIMHKKQIDNVLKSRNATHFDSIKQIPLNELSTKTLNDNKGYLKFGTLELIIAIIVGACFVLMMFAPGYPLYAEYMNGYYYARGGDMNMMYGGMNNMMYGNNGYSDPWMYVLITLMRLIIVVGAIYVYIKAALMSTIIFRQNKITKGLFAIILAILTLGIWPYKINKELNAEIDKILSSRGEDDFIEDPDIYIEPPIEAIDNDLLEA